MSPRSTPTRPPIAVVGVSALFPGSVDATGFWADILAGTDRLTPVPSTHWLIDDYFDPDPTTPDKTYGRRGGFLQPVQLDPLAFGVPPAVVSSTDTAQLLGLIAAQQVLEDAVRTQFTEIDRSRVSVILGATSGQELLGAMASRLNRPLWLQGMRRAGVPEDVASAACEQIANLHPSWTESTFPGLLGNVIAGRIANRLDLGGTNCVTDAACASSFSAISMGMNELHLGDSDLVISGGVDTMNDILMYMCFSKTPALSKTEDVRPFSDNADGTMLGEGIGMVALKRLEDAERDGNSIYCLINGVGASSDGRAKSVYAPVPAGQSRAIAAAYAKSGFGPDTVELVEAHGTGTVAGDAAEFAGLRAVFDDCGREDRQWCALGSVKSQIGHTKAAAGAAGLIKAIMAVHHGVLPPTTKIDQPNPELDLADSSFYLNTRSRPWVRGSDHARRASVSSFGFGGSNFHVALSEYNGSGRRAPRLRVVDAELVVLVGDSAVDVIGQARDILQLPTTPGRLAWLAQTSQREYHSEAAARLAVVVTDEADLSRKLEKAIDRLMSDPTTSFTAPGGTAYGWGASDGSLAFVFPGQGSQYLRMGEALAMQSRAAIDAWDGAADVVHGPHRLNDVVFPIPTFDPDDDVVSEALLTATEWAQPALAATSLALLGVLRSIGVEPDLVGGHSFGEIVALHAGGMLATDDTVRVARRRGELMAEAAEVPGSMLAVSETIDVVRSILERSGTGVVVANHNSPSQVVLSGTTSEILRLEELLAEQGLACKRLPVATAFHSPVVSDAGDAFRGVLDAVELQPPTIPVYANETAAPYPTEPDAAREQLGRQITRPVRFVDLVESMYERGARTFVEVGPSSVLTGLIASILDGREHRAVAMDAKHTSGLAPFLGGLAQLVAAGCPMSLDRLWDDYGDMPDPSDRPVPKLSMSISGANYGKPYPPSDPAELAGPNTPARTETDGTAAAPAAVGPAPAADPSPAPADRRPPAVAESPAMDVGANAIAHGAPAPPAFTAPVPPTPGSSTTPSDILPAVHAAQQQTAETHAVFLNAMAQAHTTFLSTVQQTLDRFGPSAGLPPASSHVPVSESSPAIDLSALGTVGEMPPWSAPPAPRGEAVPAAPALATPTPAVAPAGVGVPVGAGAGAVPVEEVSATLLAVIADTTGYPAEMLEPTMSLESDLGVDSIKRVEILSAMLERFPSGSALPDEDMMALAELVTIGELVERLTDIVGASAPTTTTPATTTPTPALTPAGAGAVPVEEVSATLLAVIADTTGYPAEMLEPTMSLESDLGVDSIKRVEILSAMLERFPSGSALPDEDMMALAELVTIGELVERLTDIVGASAPTTTTPATTPTTTTPTPALTPAGAGLPAGAGRRLVQVTNAPSLGTRTVGPDDGRLAVSDDGQGIGARLVELLVADGVNAELMSADPEGYDGVIFLGGLRRLASIDEALDVNLEAFRAARALGASSRVFVTVTALGGSFGEGGVDYLQSWTAGLTALSRTAAIEWPGARVKAIDLELNGHSPSDIARMLADELRTGGPELEVGLRAGGARITLQDVPADATPGAVALGPDDVVVVSGGARGITAISVVELARTTKARFVLLGRSSLEDDPPECRGVDGDRSLKRVLLDAATASGRQIAPAELGEQVRRILANREIRETVDRVAAVGGTAQYFAVDVTDSSSVHAALDEVRATMGPITALIHGAGVLADRRIVDKTDDQFDAVFNTKVAGLRTLLDATSSDRLKLLCLFSSVAARVGNEGQSDYAMANEVLNKVAIAEHTRRGADCVVKSCLWGPWAGGMVNPSLQARFESAGVAVLDTQLGAQMFVDELTNSQAEQVEVIFGNAAALADAASGAGR